MARSTGDIRDRLSDGDRVVWKELQTMPNVGPAMGYDLLRLGIRRPEDLVGRDPDDLYDQLSRLDGLRQDPCVRDVMAAVVSYAETGDPAPWWTFTPQRKSRTEPRAKKVAPDGVA